MFLRWGAASAIFSILTISPAWADDLDLPGVPVIPQTQTVGLDEPIRQIADTPAGCAVLDKDFPGLRQHAMYDFFKSLTLNQIAALSKGRITQEMLVQAQTDLLAMKASSPPVTDAAPMATSTAVAATAQP